MVRQTYQFTFHNKVGDSILQINKVYQNHFEEAFTVRSFKYYVSHIIIIYKNKKNFAVKENPHLINEGDSLSKWFSFTAPAGTITGISFLLGIDSITNVSGVQTGDLDPAKGMFWIWNTGYIMAKLEGASTSSKAPGKQYSYDIGGYKKDENAAREIILSLPSAQNHQPSSFTITADISKWFWSKNKLKISEQPMCHSPGAFAMKVADNYADMFSISVLH